MSCSWANGLTGILERKNSLRQEFRSRRDQVSGQRGIDWGPRELQTVLNYVESLSPNFQGRVLSYFPLGSEPSILPRPCDRRWLFPKVTAKGSMEWFEWGYGEPLPPKSPRGIPEGASSAPWDPLWAEDGVVCFVPSLAVDEQGHRLGYGGGFYDRFLALPTVQARVFTVACTHPDLIVPRLPVLDHDVCLDAIVTFGGIRPMRNADQILSKLGRNNLSQGGGGSQ